MIHPPNKVGSGRTIQKNQLRRMIHLDLHSISFNCEIEQIVFHSLNKQIFRGFLINDMSQIDMIVLFLAEVRKRRKNRGERGGSQVVCIVCGIVLFNQLNDHLCCYMFARVDKLEEPSTKPPQKVCPDLCMNLKQARNLHGIIIQNTQ